jgi:PQQ-like domain
VGGLAVLMVLLAAATPASGAGWQQFRNDPAGDGQSSELGAQSAAVVRGFPIDLPQRNAGLSFLNPGQVVVTPSGIVVVADGFQVSAYNPQAKRLWVKNVAPGGVTDGLGFIASVALSGSGATTFVLFSEQDPGGNADPSTLYALSTSSGAIKWSSTVGTTDQGTFIAIDGSNNVYVVSQVVNPAATGAGSFVPQVQAFNASGDSLWSTLLSGFSASHGVVLDGNGNAYTTTNTTTGQSNTPQIVSLNTSSGAINWSVSPPPGTGTQFGGPVFSNGLLYVSGGQEGPGVLAYTPSGASAGLVGTTPIEGPLTLSNAGFLLGSSTGNTAVAQSTSGSTAPAWVRGGPPQVTSTVTSLPAEAIGSDGTSYIPSSGYLLAANGTTGATEWIYRSSGMAFGSPAIGPTGTVYAVARSSKGVAQLIGLQLLPQR